MPAPPAPERADVRGRLAAIGLVAGVFSALFGVGGGVVVVPLLASLARYDARRAAATSLAAIGITALAGTISYAARGHVHLADGLLIGVPAAAGAFAGAAIQQRLPLRALSLLFAALIVFVGLRLVESRWFAFGELHGRAAWVYVLAAGIGVCAGVLAGLFGVGGGILFVPTLLFVLGHSQLDAEATSLLAILPTTLGGTWRQARYGNVARGPALTVGLASVVGVEVGVALAQSIPEGTLRRMFGALLLLVAVQIAWRARRR